MVRGGTLDICSSAMPGLRGVLGGVGVVTLGQVVRTAGPALSDAQALSWALGVQSVQLMERSLLCLHGGGRTELDPMVSWTSTCSLSSWTSVAPS